MRGTMLGVWALLLAVAAPASAEDKGWSVLSGTSVGPGHVALQLQAGWPDLSLGGHYGLGDKLDVGGRFAFSYGQDGSLGFGVGPAPGFRFQASARYQLISSGALRLGAGFSPGFGLDLLPGVTTPRILFPLQLVFGIVPGGKLMLHVGLDLPLYATLPTAATTGGVTFPILVGGGVEYALDRSLAATGQLRIGPVLEITRAGAPTHLAVQVAAGLAYRM
jgi:hypothetical protein